MLPNKHTSLRARDRIRCGGRFKREMGSLALPQTHPDWAKGDGGVRRLLHNV